MCDQVSPVTPVKKNKRGKVRINLFKIFIINSLSIYKLISINFFITFIVRK